MDFATVCYIKELPLMKLQARSMELYLKNFQVDKIFIIINGYFEICRAYLEAEVKPYYGSLISKIEYIDANQLITDLDLKFSYKNQMMLKLLTGMISDNKHIGILDSKNFFINELLEEDVFRDNRLRGYFDDTPHEKWMAGGTAVYNLYDLDYKNFGILSPQTLFFAETSILKEICMDKKVMEHCKKNKENWSEFLLVGAYICKKYNSLNSKYWDNRNTYTRSIWPGDLTEYNKLIYPIFKSHLTRHSKKVITVGLHRRCFNEESNWIASDILLENFITLWKEELKLTDLESRQILSEMKRYTRDSHDR